MKVAVTGGTGFVGNRIIEELVYTGHQVKALVRQGSEAKLRYGRKVELVTGNIFNKESLKALFENTDAIIHLVGIIREYPAKGITFQKLHYRGTLSVIEAAIGSGVKRYLHMSALGADVNSSSAYHRTKAAAEEAVKTSGLDWTIFRPSLIYGRGDKSISFFASQLKKLPVYPVIGSGEYKMQPVDADAVAQAFAKSLEVKEAIGRVFDIVGPESSGFNEMIRAISEVSGKKPRLLHLPARPIKIIASFFERYKWFPVTESQIDMLLMGNYSNNLEFYSLLGIKPIEFKEGLKKYLS